MTITNTLHPVYDTYAELAEAQQEQEDKEKINNSIRALVSAVMLLAYGQPEAAKEFIFKAFPETDGRTKTK